MTTSVKVDPVSYTHLDVYKRQLWKNNRYFESIGKSMTSATAVSYTHLDVYKRQIQKIAKARDGLVNRTGKDD